MTISRRDFLANVSAATVLALKSSRGESAEAQHGRLLIGLTGPVYFNGFCPFLNWWKTASAPRITLSSGQVLSGKEIWDGGRYLSGATGEIISPAPSELQSLSRVFYKSANHMQVAVGCNYEGEEWTAVWDGSARGTIEFLSDGKQFSVGSNQIDFTTGADPDRVALTLTLLDRREPPRNVRVFQKRYKADVERGGRFNPDWLAQVKQFGVIRFMGWMPTNDETIREFSQLADENYFAWGQQFISDEKNGEFGPKGSLHPKLICELANETRCSIHVCLPVRASDDFVREFAEYFREQTDVEVTYELSNECWNSITDQFNYCKSEGEKIWQNDPWRFAKWYGYRSAECMNIIRNVYKDRNRWRGALATQTVDIRKTLKVFAGVKYWRKNALVPSRSLKVSDLFKSLYVTGYFGFGVFGPKITDISTAYPAVCTAKRHGFREGQRVKLFVTDGPTQLHDKYFTVAACSEDTFELVGVSTIDMGRYLAACRLVTSKPLPQSPVYHSATPASLRATRTGALRVSDIEMRENDTLLVIGQIEAQHNGIYRLVESGGESVPWRLERVEYFSKTSDMILGSSVEAMDGSDAGRYVLTSTVEVLDRDGIVFSKVQPNSYAVDATLFELMDTSTEKNLRDPVVFPTECSYFNSQVGLAMRLGSCDFRLSVPESVAALEKTYWPPQFAIASAYGLTLRQYEGGCGLGGGGTGLLGNPRSLIYGGNERFGKFVFGFGHSEEAASVYAESYAAFWRVGGEYPAKFVLDGRSSNVGSWAGVRFWPLAANKNKDDSTNPVWKAVLTANG